MQETTKVGAASNATVLMLGTTLQRSSPSHRETMWALTKLLIAVLGLYLATFAAAKAEDTGPLAFLEAKYRKLDNRGKFAATAAVGFVGTRIAVNTAMGALKVGAAAFIT